MRLALIATLAIGLAASLSVPTPASADDNQLWTDCKQTGDNAKKIAACAKLVDAGLSDKLKADAFYFRGHGYLTSEEADKALADFTACNALIPEDAYCLGDMGRAYSKKRDYAKAVELYEKSIARDKKINYVWASMGGALNELGNYDKAIEALNAAIAIDPKDAWSYSKRGDVWTNKDVYDKAISDYNRAILIDPKDHVALSSRAFARVSFGKSKEALADLDKVLALKPDYAYAYALRGRIRNDNGEWAAAKEALDKAISLDDKTGWYYLQRGRIGIALKELEPAKADIDKALQIVGDPYIEAYYYQGQLHEAMGKVEEATAAYRKALDASATFQAARDFQAKALDRLAELGG